MNQTINNALLTATRQGITGKRTFFPIIDGVLTERLKAVKIGFLPMVGGDTPGGLNITVLTDVEDKLLAYFLLGGTVFEISDDMMEAFKDSDKVVILGADLSNEIKVGFMVDKFDRQIDQVIHFPQFHNVWGLEKVIQDTFLNAELYETL